MQSEEVGTAGRSDAAEGPDHDTSASPDSAPSEVWTLSIGLTAAGRLVTALGDGYWVCELAEAPWPPTTPAALPAAVAETLRRLDGVPLRLQLQTALDAWPWERELSLPEQGARPVPRYLTDLPVVSDPFPGIAPLVAAAPHGGDGHLRLVQAARLQQRPLVLTSPHWPAAQRLALERTLRSHWRGARLASRALALTLVQLGLSNGDCRLYGDGHAPLVDNEQGWRPVTALSIDVVSSTLLLQSLGAEAYAQRLHTYHERCRDVVIRFQGSLDTPQGDDGLMAYFGFPVAVEDAAARALTAAWQLAGGMGDLGLQVRVGVASGQLAVSAQQAFGPEVHLAARLCSAAQPGQVLVAASTRDRVGPGFRLEPRPEGLMLKDFGSLKGVHEMRGLRPLAVGEGRRQRGTSGFVGRRRELHALRSAWDEACVGRMQWLVVHGEAGIGKSRLLHEFSRELRAQGRRFLALTGQAQASGSPFAAVVDGLRQHWGIDPDVDAIGLQPRLVDLLPPARREGGDAGDLARLLVMSRSEDSRASRGVQRRWSELLLGCLQGLIETGPFCLLVDDVHWIDPSSVELLRRLREACQGRSLLVVLGERTESGSPTAWSSAAPLELQRLSEAEASELAGNLGARLNEGLRRRIVERAEGVPLYLEESLRMLSDRDAHAADDVPATLQDLLMVRLDELGPDRALAQLISVLGREFSAVHLDALLEQVDPFVERARQQGSLASLLHSGFLQPLDGPLPGYRFKHALIRDSAYASIWTPDRKRLHGLCADLIERSTPAISRERPERVAHHLEAAGRVATARRAWLAAAQLSATRHAHQETIEQAQRGLDLHGQVPDDAERARSAMQLHLLQASAQIALQGYGSAEVEAAYVAAEQAGSQLADTAHALRIRLGLEACYMMRGDFPRAAPLALASVAATDWSGDARLALQARWALANLQFHQGDWVAALAGFDDCLAHYQPELHRRSGVQDPAVLCLGYSSWILFELGRADEALRRIERLLELAESLQHPFSASVALGFAASIKRLCGDAAGAWPHALEAVAVCERGGFQVWLGHALMVRGQLRADRGEVQDGADDMDRGYALWYGSGARISCATYHITRAEVLLRQRRTAQAAELLTEAERLSTQIGELYYRAELLRLQGVCAWQARDLPRATATLQQALESAQRERKPGLALRCALSLGALQAAQGEWQAPAQRLRAILAGLTEHDSSRDVRWARHALPCWEAGHAFEAAESTPWEPM